MVDEKKIMNRVKELIFADVITGDLEVVEYSYLPDSVSCYRVKNPADINTYYLISIIFENKTGRVIVSTSKEGSLKNVDNESFYDEESVIGKISYIIDIYKSL